MSYRSNRDDVARCNRLSASFFDMSLRAYKTVKAATQLVAVAAGIYAMSLGADPLTVFMIIGVIVAGPELMEYLIAGDGIIVKPAESQDDGQG